MPAAAATASQLVVLLGRMQRFLHDGTLPTADCIELYELCHQLPEQLSAGERQALTR